MSDEPKWVEIAEPRCVARIVSGQVQIYSPAGYQKVPVSRAPKGIVEEIRKGGGSDES